MKSQAVQPFLQGSQLWQTDRQTGRQTYILHYWANYKKFVHWWMVCYFSAASWDSAGCQPAQTLKRSTNGSFSIYFTHRCPVYRRSRCCIMIAAVGNLWLICMHAGCMIFYFFC